MVSSSEPVLAPRARDDLRGLSVVMRGMIDIWLRRLATGQVNSDDIHRVLGSDRFRWVEFGGYAIVFRSLTDAELLRRGALLPTLLIARVVPTAELANVAIGLLAAAAAKEAAEASGVEDE